MAAYFITGRQGTGKSSVIAELKRRGYTAYNTDVLPEVTQLEDRSNGQPIDWPKGQIDWDAVAWNWQSEALRALLASDDIVFVGAVTTNQADFYPYFETIFVLNVSEATHRRNLRQHEHDYTAEDIARILSKRISKNQKYLDAGAIPINNDQTIAETAAEILRYVGLE